MAARKRNPLSRYIATFVLALCFILFVVITPSSTGGRSYTLWLDGRKSFRKGMDVAGGVRLSYKIDLDKYKQTYTNTQEYVAITKNVKEIVLKNIDNRISQLGVSDYESYLQTIGDEEFIIVEIGGVSDLDQAKSIIWKTVELEFKIPYQGSGDEVRESRQLLAEELLKKSVASHTGMQLFANEYQEDQVFFTRYENQPLDQLPEIYREHPEVLSGREEDSVYPALIEWLHSVIPPVSGLTTTETRIEGRVITRFLKQTVGTGVGMSGELAPQVPLYSFDEIVITYTPTRMLAKDPVTNEILNGAYFKYAAISQSQTGLPVATITFDDKGKEIFCNLTTQIVGQQMAIFVGGNMVTAPVIREAICGWSAQIDGSFTPADAKALVQDLNEGALPAELILSNEEKVSPKLGQYALTGALYAGLVGLVAVFVYMSLMYGVRQGIVAVITLSFFLVVLFAFVKFIGYALSLSGLAAVLLSIGMGVDANVLIYERIKEEQHAGSRAQEAIAQGYSRSRTAIRDGNVTTALIGLLLLFVGTNLFKWFGTMMIITILVTLFVMVPFIKQVLLAFERK